MLRLNFSCHDTCAESNEVVIDSKCFTCNQKCLTCTGTTENCTTCLEDYSLYKGDCIAECPLKWHPENGVCIYYGFVCEDNSVLNTEKDGCILTQKACHERGENYELSED